MYEVNNIYYSLDPSQRAFFLQMNPDLDAYQKWNAQYRKDHPDVDAFIRRKSDYYDTKEAEAAFAVLDPTTARAVSVSARSGKSLDKEYETVIRQCMANVGTTKDYDKFVKNLQTYVLGQ